MKKNRIPYGLITMTHQRLLNDGHNFSWSAVRDVVHGVYSNDTILVAALEIKIMLDQQEKENKKILKQLKK